MFQNPNLIIIIIFCILFLIFSYLRFMKDGFEFEKAYDAIFVSSAFAVLVYILISRQLRSLSIFVPDSIFLKPSTQISSMLGAFVAFFLAASSFAFKRKWSFFRLWDVIVLSFIPALGAALVVASYLFLNFRILGWVFGMFVLYALIVAAKDRFIPSGYVTSLFFVLASIILYVLFPVIYNLGYLILLAGFGSGIFILRYRDLQL